MATIAAVKRQGWCTDRRARVARLHLEGYTVQEIALSMGIRPATVEWCLRKLEVDWRRSADADYAAKKARELAKIDEVERKANREWRRSRRDAEVVKRTYEVQAEAAVEPEGMIDPFADPPKREMVLVSEVAERRGQCGDPAFLRLVKECAVERLKLMGAYEDDRQTITYEQAIGLMDAAVRAAELELRLDAGQVARLKQRTLTLLGRPVEQVGPAVVERDAARVAESDVSAPQGAEPPGQPEFEEI